MQITVYLTQLSHYGVQITVYLTKDFELRSCMADLRAAAEPNPCGHGDEKLKNFNPPIFFYTFSFSQNLQMPHL
jgi:hypothetical protein